MNNKTKNPIYYNKYIKYKKKYLDLKENKDLFLLDKELNPSIKYIKLEDGSNIRLEIGKFKNFLQREKLFDNIMSLVANASEKRYQI